MRTVLLTKCGCRKQIEAEEGLADISVNMFNRTSTYSFENNTTPNRVQIRLFGFSHKQTDVDGYQVQVFLEE